MASRTSYRLCGDNDLLSRIQTEEVTTQLQKHSPKAVIEVINPNAYPSHADTKQTPNSPNRVAFLMNKLLGGAFDALVLSASTLPARLPGGLAVGAITSRLTPYDVLISKEDRILDELPLNATIAANEIRREAQMLYYRSDLKMVRMKGSVDSLIQKVKYGKIDAVILSAADVERLHKQDCVVEFLTNSVCVPAAGQGSLAILTRMSDERTRKLVGTLNEPASFSEVKAEWSFLEHIGLCESDPVGVLGSIEGDRLELEGVVALPDGREKISSVVRGSPGQEVELGKLLADEILVSGGREVLQELNLI
ncbi:MAG: hydroxymethylbilane synthase [Candidatus Latescibacteria bacterium]|nr:hydroxymethylbilane synthase [Candidatus Latescibacterota bacterium]NIM22321.1 hydroxymethylbilane synthase [Candidatus Latescibacterota bacterium]NIM66150.1 hydroxymethylbilane synthase [Candidatus Latescibacterota bacterium]NIO02558.1 hydroxymethylbilane synthase [Candidatus Latescibacterota bacterium]NIO29472.1 hydroxymethylbilane synthase [Candidatus Latescibacterota bacterium]